MALLGAAAELFFHLLSRFSVLGGSLAGQAEVTVPLLDFTELMSVEI